MRFSWYITWVKNILFNHEKDGNPAICETMDEPWECYANEISQTGNNWKHVYWENLKSFKGGSNAVDSDGRRFIGETYK